MDSPMSFSRQEILADEKKEKFYSTRAAKKKKKEEEEKGKEGEREGEGEEKEEGEEEEEEEEEEEWTLREFVEEMTDPEVSS